MACHATTTYHATTTPATLTRSLGLRSVVVLGLAYLAPTVVLGTSASSPTRPTARCQPGTCLHLLGCSLRR
jgi:hypothetical protein